MRRRVPAGDYEGGGRCLFAWQKDFHYLSRQIDSSSIITSSHTSGCDGFFFFCISFHLLITLCSDQRAASKSGQETRAKGAPLSFYPSAVPRFLTPLQTALASGVLSEATPVRAKLYPLHPSFYFILLKQLSEDGAGEKSWNGRGC